MKFLIIDDDRHAAKKIAEAIVDLGEITVFSYDPLTHLMPSKEEVMAAVGQADFILLDGEISSEYSGKTLLPFCCGKKVLGISSTYTLGEYNWHEKDRFMSLNDEKNKSAAESLKKKIEQMLS